MATEVKTAEEFCEWLRGFLDMFSLIDYDRFYELKPGETANYLNSKQIAEIRRQLNAVFKYEIDPSLGSEAHQEKLRQAHQGELTKFEREIKRIQTDTQYGQHRDTIYKC